MYVLNGNALHSNMLSTLSTTLSDTKITRVPKDSCAETLFKREESIDDKPCKTIKNNVKNIIGRVNSKLNISTKKS